MPPPFASPSPAVVDPAPSPALTRVEALSAQYRASLTLSKSWDEVDQRWVPSSSASPSSARRRRTAPASSLPPCKTASEVSALAASAVSSLRSRNASAAADADDLDDARVRLQPAVDGWSTEHGKLKGLAGLLSTLHVVLPKDGFGGWKRVGLGDLLTDAKVKKAYYKASRMLHPDKTGGMGPDERFIAAAVFDCLCRAKREAGI